MVPCPRCGQMVDPTTQAVCPHCTTPLHPPQAASQQPVASLPGLPGLPSTQPGYNPAMPMPGANPNVRVSLTGEVIESASSTPPPTYTGSAPQRMGAAGGGIAAQKAIDDKRAKQNTIVRVFSMLVFVGLMGLGVYWFLMLRTNPSDQLKQYLVALKAENYKTVYNSSILSSEVQQEYSDPEKFDEYTHTTAKGLPGGEAGFKEVIGSLTSGQVGKAEISGSSVTVPVRFTWGGYKVKKNFHMKSVWGTWKVVDDGDAFVGIMQKLSKGNFSAFQTGVTADR